MSHGTPSSPLLPPIPCVMHIPVFVRIYISLSLCVCVSCAVGKVNKVCRDHIGLLVLGIFNASILANEIRNEYTYTEEIQPAPFHPIHASGGSVKKLQWKSSRDGVKPLEIGAHVSFVCTRYVSFSATMHARSSSCAPAGGTRDVEDNHELPPRPPPIHDIHSSLMRRPHSMYHSSYVISGLCMYVCMYVWSVCLCMVHVTGYMTNIYQAH